MAEYNDHEVVSVYPYSKEETDLFLTHAQECVLMWATQDCWPVGVYHSFIWRDAKLWITFARHRHRAAAIRRSSKVSVAVSSLSSRSSECPGGSLTVKGRGVFHEDRATKDWFYRALAHKQFPTDKALEDGFVQTLDSPLRVILEVTPEKYIAFNTDLVAKVQSGKLGEDALGPRLSSDGERMGKERALRGLPPR